MKGSELFGRCPYYTSQRVLGHKWSLYLLYVLHERGQVRFNELLRAMPDEMTHTTLTRQLKTLEADGLVQRREYAQVPPKVEYSLTEIGREFGPVLDALGAWGEKYDATLQAVG